MSSTTKANQPSVQDTTVGGAKPLRPVKSSVSTGIAAPSNGKSCSPSSAGAPSGGPSTSTGGFTKKPIGNGPKQTKAKTPKAQGIGSPKLGRPGTATKRNDIKQDVVKQTAQFRNTNTYLAAVDKGFKNRLALDKFNSWVRNSDIDPSKVRVCNECGACDLELCEHFIVNSPTVAAVDQSGALLIPTGPCNFNYRWMWVDKIKRMFVWPKFDADVVNNHNLNGFHNEQLGDSLINEQLFNYIRLGMNTSYVINGVDDRSARLAHCHKLASRFMDENKIKQSDRTETRFVNVVTSTIQRACDSAENRMLYAPSNPSHNFWPAPRPIMTSCVLAGVAAVILSRNLRYKIYIALQQRIVSIPRRLIQESWEILLNGSIRLLKQAVCMIRNSVSVLGPSIYNGIVRPCSTAIQLW